MLLCRSLEELNENEFPMKVCYVWGNCPFWHGPIASNAAAKKGFWGLLEDWVELELPPAICFLGSTRSQTFGRVEMYLSF